MRYGSVCSGIEAATAAWHHMGWEAAFFSEIEKFPCAVLEHRYPDVPLHGDFTTIKENEYGKIDLLVGGTPCQSFSVAGLRGGLDDDRGNLALEFCRLAQREQPRWIVWENVPGVLSSSGGRDFGSILGALEDLGYGLAYRVLDAQYFGVAQRRRRVFVVGYLGDWRPAAAVLFERHSMSGHSAPSREKRQEATDAVATGTGGSGGDGGVRPDLDTFECGGIGSYSASDNSSPLLRTGADLGPGCEALIASTFNEDGTARTLLASGYDASPCADRGPDVVGTLRTRRPGEGGVQGDFDHIIPVISPALNTQSGSHHAPDTKAYVANIYGGNKRKDRPEGGFYVKEEPTSKTLDAASGLNPTCSQGTTMVPPFDTTQLTSPYNYSNPQPGDPCHPLAAGAHPPAVAFPINTQLGLRGPDVSNTSRDGFGVGNEGDPAYTLQAGHNHAVAYAIQDSRPIEKAQNGRGWNADGSAYTIDTQGNQGVAYDILGSMVPVRYGDHQQDTLHHAPDTKAYVAIGFYPTAGQDFPALDELSPAVKVGTKGSSGNPPGVHITSTVRRLTPVECERLQGFPDNFTAIPWRKKGAEDCPDGPRYKALGNSMAVPVMRWIGERINLIDDYLSII